MSDKIAKKSRSALVGAAMIAAGLLGGCTVYEPAPTAVAYAPAPAPTPVYYAPAPYYYAPPAYYVGPSVGFYFGGGHRDHWH